MRETYQTRTVGSGTRLQSGIPKKSNTDSSRKSHGMLVRGVVLATYVTDDAKGHPQLSDGSAHSSNAQTYGEGDTGIAVYCDVLIYPSVPGMRWAALRNVLVTQERSGIHRGNIWKPRASSIDVVTGEVNLTLSNPAHLDGDHVLVGFLDGAMDQPIILRSLPHPSSDVGNENYNSGKRLRLKLADGDPEFWKHHGVHFGVDDSGNHIVDSTFANDGSLDAAGKEPAPPTDGKGAQTRKLPKDATHAVILYDMSNPASPVEVGRVEFKKDQQHIAITDATGKLHVQVAGGETLTVDGKDAAATLTLGNGAVAAAVADHLQALYEDAVSVVVGAVGGIKAAFDSHVHLPTAPGAITGPPLQGPLGALPLTLKDWNPSINSNKLTIPDT